MTKPLPESRDRRIRRSTVRTCLCESFARVTERAALASARWLGRADEAAALRTPRAPGMEESLQQLPIDGSIVIGASGEESDNLAAGQKIGAGGEDVRPRASTRWRAAGIVARGGSGAMTMVAAGDPGTAADASRTCTCGRWPSGPSPRGKIDLKQPGRREHPGDRRGVRPAGRRHYDDRPRPPTPPRSDRGDPPGRRPHQAHPGRRRDGLDLGRDPRTNDHLAIGIGGTRQAVLTAAALRCLGGEMQAQLWPTTRAEIERAAEHGIKDIERI